MKEMHCPDFDTLCRMEEGSVPVPQGWSEHLVNCPRCAETAGWLVETGLVLRGAAATPDQQDTSAPVEKRGTLPSRRSASLWSRLSRLPLAAAAGILLAVGLFAWIAVRTGTIEWNTPSPAASARQILPGTLYRSSEPLELTDGSPLKIRLEPGTALKALPQTNGNRIPLRIEKGEASISVPEGGTRVELHVPSGTLRDVGTEFTVRVYDSSLPWEENSTKRFSVTIVETRSGIVEMNTSGRGLRSIPGRKGYLLENGDLFLEESLSASDEPSLADRIASLKQAISRNDKQTSLRIWGALLERAAGNAETLTDKLKERQQ